jgi:hypothetical protein
MKISRPKTEKWHNWEEGDVPKPIQCYYKKGFWKRHDRKKYIRKIKRLIWNIQEKI